MRAMIAALFFGSMLVPAAQAQPAPNVQGAIQGLLGGNQRNQDETTRRAYEQGRQDQAERQRHDHYDHRDHHDRGPGAAPYGYGPGPAVGAPPPPPYYGH